MASPASDDDSNDLVFETIDNSESIVECGNKDILIKDCEIRCVKFFGNGSISAKNAKIEELIIKEGSNVALNLSGEFGTISASGDSTIIRELKITRGSVKKIHLESLDASVIRLDCNVAEIDVDSCVIHGFRVRNVSGGSKLRINDSLLFNITEISDCDYNECELRNNSLAYTRISGQYGSVDFRGSRFTMLLDLRGTKLKAVTDVTGRIDFTDSILVESMKLPEPSNYGGKVVFNNMVVKGAVDITVPSDHADNREFFDKMVEYNEVEGLKVLRNILEDNCLYTMADNTFVEQKKKDFRNKEKPLRQRTFNMLSYALGGNGMKPLFMLAWMIVIIMTFASIFFVSGMHSSILDDEGFIGSLMLSLTSFFLYDILAHGAAQMYACLAEGIIGLLSMLYFTVILTRKLVRRSDPGDEAAHPAR